MHNIKDTTNVEEERTQIPRSLTDLLSIMMEQFHQALKGSIGLFLGVETDKSKGGSITNKFNCSTQFSIMKK